ncbi:hypothetical protein BOX15_Mlig028412g3, partial [Macrostomum lignano]
SNSSMTTKNESLTTKRRRHRRCGVLSNKKVGGGTCQRCQCRMNSSSSQSLSASSSRLQLSACSSGIGQSQLLRQQQSQYHQLQQLARLKANNQDLARVNAGLQLANHKLTADAQRLHSENLQLRQRVARLPELRANLFGVLDSVYRCVEQLGGESDDTIGSQKASSCDAASAPPAAAAAELLQQRHDDEFVDEELSEEPQPSSDALAVSELPPASSALPPPQQFQPQVRVVAAAPSGSVIAEVSAELEVSSTAAGANPMSCTPGADVQLDSTVSAPTEPAGDECQPLDDLPTPVGSVAEPDVPAPLSPVAAKQRKTSGSQASKSNKSKEKPARSTRPDKKSSAPLQQRRAKSAAATSKRTATADQQQQPVVKRPARSTRRPVSYLEDPEQLSSPEYSAASGSDKTAGRSGRRTVMAVQKRPGQIRYLVAIGDPAVSEDADAKAMPPPPAPPSRKRRMPSPASGSVGSGASPRAQLVADNDPFNLSANRTANLSALPDSLQGLRERCQNVAKLPQQVADSKSPQQQQKLQKKPRPKKTSNGASTNEAVKKKPSRRHHQQQQRLDESDEADFVSLY